MQTIQVIQRGFGDHVLPDEYVHLHDGSTGKTYEIMVKSTAERPGEKGAVRVYIPDNLIRSAFMIEGHLVVELSEPADDSAVETRRQWIREKVGTMEMDSN